jgi:hypothetical protein
MKQHKWHKEIKAWADGAEIEVKNSMDIDEWIPCLHPNWSEGFTEEVDWIEYRIKLQPKEPQYLYVYRDGQHHITFTTNPPYPAQNTWDIKLLGKIKLEVDDA